METSILIAKLMGALYLSLAVGLLASRRYYKKVWEHLLEDHGYMLTSGMLAIITGLLIIEFHNIWSGGWIVLITIIGWLALIKGILLLAFPNVINSFKPMVKEKNINKFMLPVLVIFGLLFSYYGFLA